MMMMWHACVNKLLQLIVNFMTLISNKIAFIDWSKMFIMSKHVFYDLSYATKTCNAIKEITKNVFNN
jgi:hypothetical protein